MVRSRLLLPVATAAVRGCRPELPAERAMLQDLPRETKHFPSRYLLGSKTDRQFESRKVGTRAEKGHRLATWWSLSAYKTIHASNVTAHT